MPSPTFTFGFIVATLIGAAFHLIVGGDVRRLALYLVSAWVGFAVGHLTGAVFSIDTFNIGPLRAFPSVLGALIALIVAFSLTTGSRRKRVTRR